MPDFRDHIRTAINDAGSQAKLADQVGCSQQYISWLLKDADQVSAEMSVAFETATNGKISRSLLRPDLFPPTNAEQSA